MDTSFINDALDKVKGFAQNFFKKPEDHDSDSPAPRRDKQAPKINLNEVVTLDQGTSFQLSAPGADVVDLQPRSINKSIFKNIFALFMLLFVVVVGVYFSLAATLVRAVPIGDGAFVVVKSGEFVGGVPAMNDKVFVDYGYIADTTTVGKLKSSLQGVTEPAVMTNIAGPFGDVTINPETQEITWSITGKEPMTWNAASMGYSISMTETNLQLDHQYLMACDVGVCKGQIVVVDAANIAGKATKIVNLSKDDKVQSQNLS